MTSVRIYGVYDLDSHQLLSETSLCSALEPDDLGTYPEDPKVVVDSIIGGNETAAEFPSFCFYGGQVDPAKGNCAAATTFSADRRICPCSQFGKGPDYYMATRFYLQCSPVVSFSQCGPYAQPICSSAQPICSSVVCGTYHSSYIRYIHRRCGSSWL